MGNGIAQWEEIDGTIRYLTNRIHWKLVKYRGQIYSNPKKFVVRRYLAVEAKNHSEKPNYRKVH